MNDWRNFNYHYMGDWNCLIRKSRLIYLIALLAIILILSVGCDRAISYGELEDFGLQYTEDSASDTNEDLYPNNYDDAFSFRNLELLYSIYGSEVYYVAWNPFILSYCNGNIATSVCKDPLCDHMSEDCITYDIFRGKMPIINGILYYRGMQTTGKDGIVTYTLNSINLNTMRKKIVYKTNNLIQSYFNVGKYFYIIDSVSDDQNALIRIDLYENKATKLALYDSSSISQIVGYNSKIYYIKYGKLCVSDYNFMHENVIVEDGFVKDFGITDGKIYFSTFEAEEYSNLYEFNIDTQAIRLLVENVYSYYVDKGNLYFALYNPIDGYTVTDGDEEYIISIPSGNAIYVVDLNDIDRSGISNAKKFISAPDGYFYYDTFFVHDNYLYAVLRSRYLNEQGDYTHGDYFMRTHINEIKWEELTSYLPF